MRARAFLVLAAGIPCALPLTAACGVAQEPARRPAETALRTRLEFDTGLARAVGLLAHDLDGDGADELVTLLRGPGALRVTSRLSNRPGRPPRHADVPVGDYAIGPVRVGTWKRGADGGPAIAAIAQREEPMLVLVDVRKLHATGSDAIVASIPLPARPRAIASGDLDADGEPDVVVATIDDRVIVVRAGAVSETVQLDDSQITCLAIEADGSGILAGSQAMRTITRKSAGGSPGSFAAVGPELPGLPRDILDVGGWAGDQRARYVVALGDHDVTWLDSKLSVVHTETTAAVPIDLDLHGAAPRRVLLATSVHGQEARVLREDGGVVSFYAGQHPNAGALGDFDGDGALDAAFANGDAKRVSVAFGRAGGSFELPSLAPSGRSPHSLGAGDLNGDGRVDLVALCALEGTLRVHAGRADGTFDAGVVQGPAEGANRARVLDLDRDGKADVMFLRETDRGVVLDAWFGDGQGRLWPRGENAPVRCAGSPGDLLVADLDGDGSLEAVVTDPDAGKVAIVPLDAAEPGRVAIGTPLVHEFAGRPTDLALVAREDSASVLAVTLAAAAPRRGFALVSASRAAFAEREHHAISERPRAVAADVVSGTIGVLCGEDSASALFVFERDAATGTLLRRDPRPGGLRAFALRAADLDGNGHVDFVASAQNSHHLNLWLGAGNSIWRRTPDLGAGTGPLDLLVQDLDGDGAPEIVVASTFSDEIATIRLR